MLLGYLFLAISVAAGAIKGHCSKKISGVVDTTYNITLLNAVRMLLCTVIGFLIVVISSKGFNDFKLDKLSAIICVLSGIVNAFFIITWTLSVKKSAFSLLSVFLVLSTIIPAAISYFVWGKAISVLKLVGFLVLFVGVVFMWIYSNKVKGKFKIKDIILLFVCGLMNGGISLTQTWLEYECPDFSKFSFNFYTYLLAFVVLLIFYFLSKKTTKIEEKFEIKSSLLIIVILSVCLFANSIFQIFALSRLGVIIFPLAHGLGLIVSTTIAHFLYGEKVNKYTLIGVGFALVSFVLMVL